MTRVRLCGVSVAPRLVVPFILSSLLSALGMAQTFVQVNSVVPATGLQVSAAYTKAQVSGDLNIVIVGWSDSTAVVSSVSDSKGNLYSLAVGPTVVSGAVSQSIYFAKNILAAAAGTNTVTVKFNITASYPDIRILEYSGLDTNSPLDAFSTATGSAITTDSGPVFTSNPNDLLVAANTVLTLTSSAGSGFSNRIITYPDGDIAEDRLLSSTGSFHATATLSSPGSWVMQAVAFKASGAAPAPSAPSNLTASVISSSQINLSWGPSTESGGTVTSYLIERCQAVACSNFAQIASSTSPSFNDTGLSPSTSYSYRVRASDTLNNLGPYSNTATASTTASGSPSPTAPSNLTASIGTAGPIVLASQGYINSTSLISHSTLPFDSTAGDVLVLCASSHAGVTMSPSDNFGNSYISVSGPTSTTVGDDLRTQVWLVRNPSTGSSHSVTMNLSLAQPLVMSIFVIKGSNLSSPLDAVSPIGTDNGTQSLSVTSPNITTTTPNDLLIGFAKSSFNAIWTAGPGFTAQPNASSDFLFAEIGSAPTPGLYNAIAGVGGPLTWEAVVVAVSPAAGTNPNQINLTWNPSTESGGTVASYLIERCQGVACSNFAQIATAASTHFTDSALTPATSYSYRVRATDTNNNLGPYSNLASAATP
jgi:chitodextrinase